MSYLSILVLAVALSIDAMVVSFSYGLVYKEERFKNAMLLSFFTAAFQGFMPFGGYFITTGIKSNISNYADWIVFFIFAYLGIKFIIEAFQKQREKELCIDLKCLFLIGIATSIDAFSAGITLSLSGNTILVPAIIIALVTFVNSNAGFFLGGRLKNFQTKWLEVFGGILLIGLALKVLF